MPLLSEKELEKLNKAIQAAAEQAAAIVRQQEDEREPETDPQSPKGLILRRLRDLEENVMATHKEIVKMKKDIHRCVKAVSVHNDSLKRLSSSVCSHMDCIGLQRETLKNVVSGQANLMARIARVEEQLEGGN